MALCEVVEVRSICDVSAPFCCVFERREVVLDGVPVDNVVQYHESYFGGESEKGWILRS